jgi:hypothetical protein
MTQVMQPVGTPQIARNKKGKCWFHEQEPEKKKSNAESESPASPEGPEEGPENGEHNEASVLGSNLIADKQAKPQWTIKHKVDPKDPIDKGKETAIVPAAHHLLPGNASMNKATELHKYMLWDGDDDLELEGPIGYDINSAENGVWLPGNYAVRKDTEFGKNWSKFDDPFKNAYAVAAMERAGNLQLHDAHPEYNSNVLSTLNDIAKKLDEEWKDRSKCPICKEKLENKNRPPYGLVGRLNAVSAEHRKALKHPMKNRKAIGAGYYTSSRVLLAFKPIP